MASALPSAIDVAIVGAGAAGIAAGRRLASHGATVLLIDALDRLGGRAHTVQVDEMALDLGCGWLHSAERNPWVGEAEALGFGVDRSPAAWRVQYRNLGFPADKQQAAGEAFARFGERLHARPPASDIARDALDPTDAGWTGYIEALSSYMNGAELAELSVADYLAYEDAASERNWRLPQGYGALIAARAAGLSVALGTTVARIVHDGNGVRLESARGPIRARAAIVTVSTAVLANGALALPPVFDAVAEAATRLPLGLADKLFLYLPDAESLPAEQHLLGNPHRAETGSYYIRPFGRPLIEGFFGGAAARALENAGDGAMAAFAREELGALLGKPFAASLRPLAASAWARCATIGGSYSHALPGHASARRVLAAPVDERILIAGEASSAQDFTTAHGAYESGIAAADRLAVTLGVASRL